MKSFSASSQRPGASAVLTLDSESRFLPRLTLLQAPWLSPRLVALLPATGSLHMLFSLSRCASFSSFSSDLSSSVVSLISGLANYPFLCPDSDTSLCIVGCHTVAISHALVWCGDYVLCRTPSSMRTDPRSIFFAQHFISTSSYSACHTESTTPISSS